MKTFYLICLFTLTAFITQAHDVSPLCWSNGKYTFRGTSLPLGNATVRVYSNSNYTGLIQSYTLNVTASQMNFDVNQPVRTTIVYVKVTWSDSYVTKNPSGTNQCTVTAIKYLQILKAVNDGNNTIITFKGESTTDNEKVTLNFTLPNGSTKHVSFVFWAKLEPDDIWVVTYDNIMNSITTIKKR